VVATAEELMFRGVLLNLFGPQFGIWIQAFLFALWHSYAYQVVWYDISFANMNIISLGIAFVFGILLGFVAMKKELGLPATIGIHAAYNLAILGALTVML
jgi:membrane protease YdiL (CAAX protease family)